MDDHDTTGKAQTRREASLCNKTYEYKRRNETEQRRREVQRGCMEGHMDMACLRVPTMQTGSPQNIV